MNRATKVSEPIELPGTFDKWPEEDQMRYLSKTTTKHQLMRDVFESFGIDHKVGRQYAVRESWAKLYLELWNRGLIEDE